MGMTSSAIGGNGPASVCGPRAVSRRRPASRQPHLPEPTRSRTVATDYTRYIVTRQLTTGESPASSKPAAADPVAPIELAVGAAGVRVATRSARVGAPAHRPAAVSGTPVGVAGGG